MGDAKQQEEPAMGTTSIPALRELTRSRVHEFRAASEQQILMDVAAFLDEAEDDGEAIVVVSIVFNYIEDGDPSVTIHTDGWA